MKLTCLLFMVIFLSGVSVAQNCPSSSDNTPEAKLSSRLTGVIVFHDSLRKWLELRTDKAVCGKPSIQLVRFEGDSKDLEKLRGCRVQTDGPIGESPTGYYSLELYQNVQAILPIGKCEEKPLPKDYSNALPLTAVHHYKVMMTLDNRPGDHPLRFRVTDGTKELSPWQAYASYRVTGGFVLYASCAKGFEVDEVFGDSDIVLGHSEEPHAAGDQASFDAEGSGSNKFQMMGYTCIRLQK